MLLFTSKSQTRTCINNYIVGLIHKRHIIQAQELARFARLIVFLLLIGLRQGKVVDGIHGRRCIHGGFE